MQFNEVINYRMQMCILSEINVGDMAANCVSKIIIRHKNVSVHIDPQMYWVQQAAAGVLSR